MPGETEVRERLALYQRTFRIAALGPGLDEATRNAARREIERVVRAALAGHAAEFDEAPPCQPYALGVAAFSLGVGALLGRWIAEGRVTASRELTAVYATHLDQSRAFAARVERELLP